MNAVQRTEAALAFRAADRPPVIPQLFGHAAYLCGVPLSDYLRDGELLARCQLAALERYRHDAVFALMDTSVESEALGSVLRYRDGSYPTIERYALEDPLHWERLALPDPQAAGRMPQLLEAAASLRRQVGDEALVVGCVLGPFTVASQLVGSEKLLFLALDHTDEFCRFLAFCGGVAERFGLAQLRAGVHLPLVFEPCASPEVVPPRFFREFILPRLESLFSSFSAAGALANWLHIAGDSGRIFPFYPQAAVQIANVDYGVDLAQARSLLPGICLCGNLRPLSFIDTPPARIEEEARRLVREFGGGGFILSSGCEIPPEAPPEAVAALVRGAQERG